MILKSNKIELQYFFNDNSHSMNAFIYNECKKEFLLICKEVINILKINIDIESEAIKEGNLINIWKALGKNSNQATFFLGLITLIISRFPVENKELLGLQIENIKLDNELKRRELLKIMRDSVSKSSLSQSSIDTAADALKNDLKINIHKSNFYNKLNNYPKVTHISTRLTYEDKPTTNDSVVDRKDFDKFLIHTDNISNIVDEDAIIEIASPILIDGRFKWRGIYKGEIFNFDMNDTNFKKICSI